MVILVDGEKFACDACLKGHRVSSCSHRERQLHHVQKKGRPVSQCPHCRGLRKSRATHVRCCCADPPSLKEGWGDRILGERRCQCGSGLPCTCALKREGGIDDLQKSATLNAARTHRRAHSYGKPVTLKHRSDALVPPRHLQGLHPTLRRVNNAAHESTWPYSVKQFTASTPNINMPTLPDASFPYDDESSPTPTRHINATENSNSTYLHPLIPHPSMQRSTQSTSNLPQFFEQFSELDTPSVDNKPDITSTVSTPTFNFPSSTPSGRAEAGTSAPAGPDQMDFQPAYDSGFTRDSLSAGNPSRYSVNDFTHLNWPAFSDSNQFYTQPAYSASASQLGGSGSLYNHAAFAASTGQLQPELSVWHEDVSDAGYDNSAAQTPQRNSMISLDHPGLTHSPSNTVSDVDSTAYHSDAYAGQAARPTAHLKTMWSAEDTVSPQTIANASNSGQPSLPMADLSLAYRPQSNEEAQHDYFAANDGTTYQGMGTGSDSPFLGTGPNTMYSADANGSGLIDLDEGMEVSNFNPDLSVDEGFWETYTNDTGYEQQNPGMSIQSEDGIWRQQR